MAKITAPVEGFHGAVGGVQFSNSTAETDNEAVISYCLGAGYKVERKAKRAAAPKPDDE